MAESLKPQPPAAGSSAVVVTAADPSVTSSSTSASTSASKPRPPPRQKYSRPLPVRTFPLPTFYPNNPLSLVHLAVAWASQVLGRPSHVPPQKVYTGTWCAATRSVNVSDPASMNDLWCQGFFGKGSLSRSEPSWMLREKARERDRLEANATADKNKNAETKTSEQRTNRRREERADTKWERGRLALEAIEKRKQEEAEAATVSEAVAAAVPKAAETTEAKAVETETYIFTAPVGPLELLALPNSEADLLALKTPRAKDEAKASTQIINVIPKDVCSYIVKPPIGPLELLALPNSAADLAALLQPKDKQAANGTILNGSPNGSAPVKPKETTMLGPAVPEFKRQKSVRFSPTVESTTFGRTDPPSPNIRDMSPEKADSTPKTPPTSTIVNKEHLQLAPEEAFFLSYALGALRVVDDSGRELSTQELFWLFAENASFPPTPNVSPNSTAFLTSYSVYHHFRALGWVPRHGIKFGVDWMLYGKGPALDHAEFGVMVMPGQKEQKQKEKPKSWHWLHSINRVLSTVYKSMVLVYVNVPAMPTDKSVDVDVTELLQAVEIRDVVVRRWSSNRNRD